MASVSALPRAALDWLVGATRSSILLVGAAESYASVLTRAGHSVTVIDPDEAALARLSAQRFWVHVAVARPETLPFDPSCFSTVLAVQNFHTVRAVRALPQWARVLKSQGRVSLVYVTRDDSVPWVKRLKAIVQSRLPEAMSSDYGTDSVSGLDDSVYFPRVEKTSFRLWVPSTRAQLQDSARHAPGAEELAEEELDEMVDQIGKLYDRYARAPEPMLLPYQILCWRAQVERTELSSPGQAAEGVSMSW